MKTVKKSKRAPVLRASLVALLASALGACQTNSADLMQTKVAAPSAPVASAKKQPNILLIVADDLGYSEMGAFGSEISTPNLDQLARAGVRMTQFYASPFCSPTRAMLMSGADNHKVGLGGMAELLTPQQRTSEGYDGYLNDKAVPFPALLRDAGYTTFMAGKWHLGMKEEHSPANRGFDRSYAMLQGGAGHFDQTGIITFDAEKMPQAQYRENGQLAQVPEGFYSSTFYASKIISYIEENRPTKKPFFGYLAFTAPHWPIQAPKSYIDKYEGKYDVGYEVIREQRLARMKQLGIVPKDMKPYVGNPAWPRWNELTERQKKIDSKRMAVYAAMVDAMDAEIGRVIAHLKQIGEYDNTVIFFLSDNGADGNTVLDEGKTREWAHKYANNNLEDTGKKGTFLEYGPGWAQVGSTPFNMYKAFMYEGGIAVPSIVVMPGGSSAGAISNVPAHVTDIAPTLLQLAGVKPVGSSYKGRSVVPMTGTSMVGFLSGQTARVHDNFSFGWELNGRRAYHKGDWKIVEANKPWGSGQWELYNLREDRAELNNLVAKEPAKFAELLAGYQAYVKENGVVEFDGLAERKGYSNSLNYYKDMDVVQIK